MYDIFYFLKNYKIHKIPLKNQFPIEQGYIWLDPTNSADRPTYLKSVNRP